MIIQANNKYNGRKAIVIGLVTCLLALSFSAWGATPKPKKAPTSSTLVKQPKMVSAPRGHRSNKTPSNFTSAKQQVDLLGVGAKVKIKLTDGKKLQGKIKAVDDEGFFLNARWGAKPRRITYNQVVRLNPTKLKPSHQALRYRPAPAEVREMVTGLGVDNHVRVELAGGKKYRGRIQAIEPDQFTIFRLGIIKSSTLRIAYRDVRRVKQQKKAARTTRTVGKYAAAVAIFTGWIAGAIVLECGECLPGY